MSAGQTPRRIHCSTCHDFNPASDPHVTGKYLANQAPLRVPGGVGDTAFLEKTEAPATVPAGQSLSYRAANTCIFCHKSRKDVTLYVDLLARLGVASLNAAGPVASFGLARALGYADEISNTVVDAIGDISGGVRLHDGTSEESLR